MERRQTEKVVLCHPDYCNLAAGFMADFEICIVLKMIIEENKNSPSPFESGQRGAILYTYSLFWNLQLLPGVNRIRGQPIQRLNFLVPRAAAKLFGSDAPEGVALDHGVGFIGCRG